MKPERFAALAVAADGLRAAGFDEKELWFVEHLDQHRNIVRQLCIELGTQRCGTCGRTLRDCAPPASTDVGRGSGFHSYAAFLLRRVEELYL